MIRFSTDTQLTDSGLIHEAEKAFDNFKARTDVGFTQLPKNKTSCLQAKSMAKNILSDFEHLVVIGIGGSSMGPRALAEITQSDKISFIDNVDSVETERILNLLKDLKKTAWLMISKSGSTIEVLCNLDLVSQYYSEKNIPFFENTFYITEDTSNPLKTLATKFVRPILNIPLNVGGRYSVLSPVGLVIAEYLNISSIDILEGADRALMAKREITSYVSQYFLSQARGENITLFWFYNSNMRWFGSWLQQLWAESLGKSKNIQGEPAFTFSTPMISIGTCDQHSILQQILEGPKNKFVNIFRFASVENSRFKINSPLFEQTQILRGLNYGELIKAEALSTEQALRESSVSTLLIELDSVDAKNIGFLFMFFQLVVATLGECKNLNAFDQPAVELGKKLTLQFLSKLQK